LHDLADMGNSHFQTCKSRRNILQQ